MPDVAIEVPLILTPVIVPVFFVNPHPDIVLLVIAEGLFNKSSYEPVVATLDSDSGCTALAPKLELFRIVSKSDILSSMILIFL